jgi:hypothetical protein
MSDNKKPAARVTISPITATIWRNETRDGTPFYSTVFESRFRGRDGNWNSSQSYSADQLLILSKVADRAHDEVLRLKAAERTSAAQEEGEPEAA